MNFIRKNVVLLTKVRVDHQGHDDEFNGFWK
jgi:hypothetical protein